MSTGGVPKLDYVLLKLFILFGFEFVAQGALCPTTTPDKHIWELANVTLGILAVAAV